MKKRNDENGRPEGSGSASIRKLSFELGRQVWEQAPSEPVALSGVLRKLLTLARTEGIHVTILEHREMPRNLHPPNDFGITRGLGA